MTVKFDRDNVSKVHEYYKQSTHVDFDEGRLRLDGLPIIWARAELLYDIHYEIYKVIGDAVHALVRKITLPYGVNFCKWLENNFEVVGETPSRENMLGFLCSETMAIGWGAIVIDEEPGRISVTAEHGFPVGKLYSEKGKDLGHPVDAYMIGYFEGFFSCLDKTVYRTTESTCVARGDKSCQIVLEKV